MARRELGPAALRVAQAVAQRLPAGPVLVGVSGGADSLALALGTAWAAPRAGAQVRCVVVDHGLQSGSAEVADGVAATLRERGLRAEVRRVAVTDGGGLEAAAREARLAALTRDGHPVLLGHTLDDQAETVLLGLLRGSGLRSLAAMAPVRGLLRRPLLGLRRADTEAACREWGIDWWCDPMNQDPRFARVRARTALALLDNQLGRDLAVALARTARLAAADADYLETLAAAARAQLADGNTLDVAGLAVLPEALRGRVLLAWLRELGAAEHVHVDAVAALVDAWHGQGPVAVPGGSVRRVAGRLIRDA